MIKSYRIGTVLGIPFRLDITFLLILPVFAALIGAQIGEVAVMLNDLFGTEIQVSSLEVGLTPWLLGFVTALALFACVTVHEFGHAVVAMHFGYEVESITLWLLGGVAKPGEQPRNWVQEFWIAIAGPAVNLIIVALSVLVVTVIPLGNVLLFLVVYLALLNVVLAVFNMLPAFPLDGGRVLRALLARSQSYVRATQQAAAIGKGVAVLLGLLGVLAFNPILVAIALFVYIAAGSETKQLLLDTVFEDYSISDVMTPAGELTTVDPDTALSELLDIMLSDPHRGYPVVADGNIVGLVTLEDVKETANNKTVASAMTPLEDLTTVTPDADAMDAFSLLGESEIGRLPVVTPEGTLSGLVTRTDLMRTFRIVMEQERDVGNRPPNVESGL